MDAPQLRANVRARLGDEVGTIMKDAPERVALVYPSPYRTGMSSLGFQTIYREINSRPGRSAERAFLPDEPADYRDSRTPLFTYEAQRPVGDFPVIGLSVAYELELSGVITTLELSGVPPLAKDRNKRHPFVLAGGPLTFSNPVPLGPFVDAVLMGEADDSVHTALDAIFGAADRGSALEALAAVDHCYVPSVHGEALPAMGRSERIPAYSAIMTPHTELRDMFLIEGERGCSRTCAYCVMRRGSAGGMRMVPMDEVLGLIPAHAKRVGLVGAAISDHPKIADMVERLAERGLGVGLSSLRPDRLNDRFVGALARAGTRTLTTAADGASQRLRNAMDRKAKETHLVQAAELVRAHGLERLKLYMIVGLPDETDDDLDELIAFATKLSKIAPLSLAAAPFVSKRNTPLDRRPFAGISIVEKKLARLRRGLRGRVDLRATSARWAWVEYVLAQGGAAEGLALYNAVQAGGRFKDYKAAFEALPRRQGLPVV